tara:strand:+ start:6897 stop:7562 length:666 start_codon:yes stop_codon:yes gene_type:complete
MAYFDQFSDLLLQSFTDSRTSSTDYVKVKNIFRRAKIREDLFRNALTFGQFTIVGDDRPDTVAEKMYGRADLDWVILLSNNILDVRNEWPVTQGDFYEYLSAKYTEKELTEVHHWETREIRDPGGDLLLTGGMIVDENFAFSYTYDNIRISLAGAGLVKSVSNLDYEIALNDKKRTIFVLRKEYLQTVIDDLREIMTYTDSSQFIDKRTKKGVNLRILSPR